jgi:hypothetical protein
MITTTSSVIRPDQAAALVREMIKENGLAFDPER